MFCCLAMQNRPRWLWDGSLGLRDPESPRVGPRVPAIDPGVPGPVGPIRITPRQTGPDPQSPLDVSRLFYGKWSTDCCLICGRRECTSPEPVSGCPASSRPGAPRCPGAGLGPSFAQAQEEHSNVLHLFQFQDLAMRRSWAACLEYVEATRRCSVQSRCGTASAR